MKKLLALLVLLPMIPAISLEQAGDICKNYAVGDELIQVNSVECPNTMWVCNFRISGEEQPVLVALDENGNPLDTETKEIIIRDIIETLYLRKDQQLFYSQLLTQSTLLRLNDLNATFALYARTVSSLYSDGYLQSNSTAAKFISLQEDLAFAMSELMELGNLSSAFLGAPGCITKNKFLSKASSAIGALNNFTDTWKSVLDNYNSDISSIQDEAVIIQSASLSNVLLVRNQVSQFGQQLNGFEGSKEEYINTVFGNLETRLERKEAKDLIQTARVKLEKTPLQDAADKYNGALTKFNNADYKGSISLATQSINMIEEYERRLPDDGQDDVGVETGDDRMLYYAIITLLVVIILAFVVSRSRTKPAKKTKKEDEEKETKDLPKSWEFVSEKKKTALEKAGE